MLFKKHVEALVVFQIELNSDLWWSVLNAYLYGYNEIGIVISLQLLRYLITMALQLVGGSEISRKWVIKECLLLTLVGSFDI